MSECYRGGVERDELVQLLSPQGLDLLDSLPAWTSSADVVRTVADLRKQGHSPGMVAAVLSQSMYAAVSPLLGVS